MSKHSPSNGSAAAFQLRSLVEGLPDGGVLAIREAVRYLMRGPGKYQPVPRISGVDSITVKCCRKFGDVPETIRELKIKFETLWNTPDGQRRLRKQWKLPPPIKDPDTEKEWYCEQFMRDAQQMVSSERASAEYVVSFQGSAGNWSATFAVGCTAFVNTPHIDREETLYVDRLDDYF